MILRTVLKSKEGAVRAQDFEIAGQFRVREMEIKSQITAIALSKKGEVDVTKEPVVTEDDIAQIVASWTGIPVNKLTRSESEKLLQMEDTLHGRIIGQDEAVVAVSTSYKKSQGRFKKSK